MPWSAVVVGAGFIGPVHVEALLRAGVHVAGILGSTAEKSARHAARLGLPRGYASLAEVLSDASVDVVHLTTPNHLHFEQATQALHAGKHVLCEKPLALTSHESGQLVELARLTGRAAGVAYNARFYPLCQEAAQRFGSGSLGRLFHITGSYVQDWLLYAEDFNWRVLEDEGGAMRAAADIGTHLMDLLQFITGARIVQVCADLQTVHPVRARPLSTRDTFSGRSDAALPVVPARVATEDYGSVMFRLTDGAAGVMWVSQVTAGRKNCLRWELAGAEKSLGWNSERPNELWIGHRGRANELLIRDPALLSERAAQCTSYPGGHNEGYADTFKQLFRAFYGYLERGDPVQPPPFPTFEDGHREIVLCEAILRSHRERRWVDIESGG